MDDEELTPEEQAPDPQEFREELEEGAQQDQEVMSDAPGVELPEQPTAVEEMADMGSDAAAEEQLDQPPPEIPEQAPEPPAETLSEPEPPPLADLAEMGEAAAEEAEVGVHPEPPIIEEVEAMGEAADSEVPPAKTQTEQIKAAQPKRDLDLFEFDTGTFEADQGGMDFMQAESSYREVNFHWQRLMTAMIVDHQHRLEQLLAMLERER